MPPDEILPPSNDANLIAAVPIPNAGPLTDAQRVSVCDNTRSHMKLWGFRVGDLPKLIGHSDASVWSKVLKRKYPESTLDDHLRALNCWVETEARRRALRPERRFVETRVAKTRLDLAKVTHRSGTMAIGLGPTGVGKTMTAQVIVEQIVGSIYLAAGTDCKTAKQLSEAMYHMLRLGLEKYKRGTAPPSKSQRIFGRLYQSNRLIVLDEAHRLDDSALDFTRDLHDHTGCPVLFIATIDLWERIERAADEDHGQLYSRIAMAIDVTEGYRDPAGGRRLFTKDDIRALYDTPKLRLANDAVDYLQDVANRFGRGSLRRCGELVMRAAMRVRRMNDLAHDAPVTLTGRDLYAWERTSRRDRFAAHEIAERGARFVAAG